MIVNNFKNSLINKDDFSVIWEQVPGRVDTKDQCVSILRDSELAAGSGIIDAISITDNPNGNPAFAGTFLGIEIKKTGIDPIVHLATRDRNRNEIESQLYGLAYNDIRNILAMSGDFPSDGGYEGKAHPVFDLDPVHVMQIIEVINRGKVADVNGLTPSVKPDLFAGVVFSQYKRLESEVMCQYYKLDKKIRAGADYVVTQIGYDARKAQELLIWLKQNGYDIPAVANIYALSYPVAKKISEKGLPGIQISPVLLKQLEDERQSPDRGKQARLERAAGWYAVVKGLGYSGAHIGGFKLGFEDIKYIVERGEELSDSWQDLVPQYDYPLDKGFYLYEKGEFLNSETPVKLKKGGRGSVRTAISKAIDSSMFAPTGFLFKPTCGLMKFTDKHKVLKSIFSHLEFWGKDICFGCLRCGDCALIDVGFNCPVSQCPKGERVGICGGSIDGWCEVYPGKKKCVWVKAYENYRSSGNTAFLAKHITPPRDWSLWMTSSWLNYFNKRDHASNMAGLVSKETLKDNKDQ